MRHDRNHNELWQLGWQNKNDYGILLVTLFQAFSQENYSSLNGETKQVAELFKQATGRQLPQEGSAVKVYLPTSVQGVNRIKADSNKVDFETIAQFAEQIQTLIERSQPWESNNAEAIE